MVEEYVPGGTKMSEGLVSLGKYHIFRRVPAFRPERGTSYSAVSSNRQYRCRQDSEYGNED